MRTLSSSDIDNKLFLPILDHASKSTCKYFTKSAFFWEKKPETLPIAAKKHEDQLWSNSESPYLV